MKKIIMLALFVVAIAGCHPHVSQAPITVTASAPKVVQLPNTGTINFPVTVQLQNHTAQHVKLFASTPCSVFQWVVMSGDWEVQAEPNWLCAQVVATDVLIAGRTLRTAQEIELDPELYVAGQYRLRYTFWNHAGYVDFTVTDAN